MDRTASADLAHVARLELAVWDLANIVRLAKGPLLELDHRHRTLAPSRRLTTPGFLNALLLHRLGFHLGREARRRRGADHRWVLIGGFVYTAFGGNGSPGSEWVRWITAIAVAAVLVMIAAVVTARSRSRAP